MPLSRSLPSPDLDFAVYIVLDDFGKAGQVYCEAELEETSLADVVDNVITGQYNNPSRIVAFNTAEGWARDVTEDVAREVLGRVVREDIDLRGTARAFVERETGAMLPSK